MSGNHRVLLQTKGVRMVITQFCGKLETIRLSIFIVSSKLVITRVLCTYSTESLQKEKTNIGKEQKDNLTTRKRMIENFY